MQSVRQYRSFATDPSVLQAVAASRSQSSSTTTLAEGFAGDDEKLTPPQFVVGFAPGDSKDPHNWSVARRWFYTLLVAHISAVVGIAGTINSAATTSARADLHVGPVVIALDTALFLFGMGGSAVFLAPMSELQGRNPVYISTVAIFVLLEVGCALSPNMAARGVLRFLAGLAGSTPLSNIGGTLADMWSPSERTAPFCFYAAFGLAGMMLGPPIGGFVGETLGYRWCDWISAIWGGLALLSCIIFLPETLAPILLKYKAQHLRRLTGDTRYRTSLETLRLSVPFKEHFKEALSRPFLMAVQEPIVILFSAYISVIYIVLLGNLSIYPVIFLQWGISDGILGLTFLPVMIGLLMAGALTPLVVKFHKMEVEKCRKEGKLTGPPPEERLRFAMVGTWCLPLSLFWLAWTCYPTKSIWISLASQLFFGIGTAACFISTYQYIIDAYLSTAASALSVLTLIRYFIAGAAVLFTIPMVNTLGVHWATTLLAFISLAFCPVPFIFYYYGATIRRWSKYTPRLPGDPVPDKSLA